MKIKDFLKKSNWTKGWYAKNKAGQHIHPRSEEAVKFCLVGATEKCYPEKVEFDIVIKRLNLYRPSGFTSLPTFNDDPDTTFEKVMRVVEAADV